MMSIRATLAGLVACLSSAIAPQAADRKPNIIFTLADDLGYGHLGCHGDIRPIIDECIFEPSQWRNANPARAT
jgi:hypothetical protein